jgi:surface protein
MKKIFFLFVALMTSQNVFAQTDPFITRWNLATAGSGANQLVLNVQTSGTVNYTWETVPAGTSGSGTFSGTVATITGLPTGATIDLSIAPTNFKAFNTDASGYRDRNRLQFVRQWGDVVWVSMYRAFYGCANIVFTATDTPNLSAVTDMSEMFDGAIAFNQSLNDWDVSNVTNMKAMFRNAYAFNGDISNWKVSNVTNMEAMFYSAGAFNQDLNDWDVSNVTNMQEMFAYTTAFNGDISSWDVYNVTDMKTMFYSAAAFNGNIGSWDVSNVTDMKTMFTGARAFNQDLNDWDVSNVTNMHRMFFGANAFNQDLNDWDVSNVTNMNEMFAYTTAFNGDISGWDVSNVTNMSGMFGVATAFNGDISDWDVSNVTDMSYMFYSAAAFNQDLPDWNASNVTDMSSMFYGATAFNGDLSNWNIPKVTNMSGMFSNAAAFNQDLNDWDVSNVTNISSMFKNAVAFNQDLSSWNISSATYMFGMFQNSGVSRANYDAMLIAWDTAGYRNKNLGEASPLTYCAGRAARANLIAKGWRITGDTDCSTIIPPVSPIAVVTGAVSAQTPTSTTLHGSINPGGQALTSAQFEISTNPSFDAFETLTLDAASLGAGRDAVAVQAIFAPIVVGQVYYYRLRAMDASRNTIGEVRTFVNRGFAPFFLSKDVASGEDCAPFNHEVLAFDYDTDEIPVISLVSAPSWITFSQANGKSYLTANPTQQQTGVFPVVVQVKSGADVVSQTITITIQDLNHAPVFTSQAPSLGAIMRKGQSHSFTFSATDCDGDAVTLRPASFPAWFTTTSNLSGQGTATASFAGIPQEMGNYMITMIATDGKAEASQGYSLQTTAQYIPLIVSTPPTAIEATKSFVYDLKAESDDGDLMIYTVEQAPDWLKLVCDGAQKWQCKSTSKAQLIGTPSAQDLAQNASVKIMILDDTPYSNLRSCQVFTFGTENGKSVVKDLKQTNCGTEMLKENEAQAPISLKAATPLITSTTLDNYPNPFNPSTNFTLAMATDQHVEISVYDLTGRKVATLHNGTLAGQITHTFAFNGSQLASGKYLVRVQGDDFAATKLITLLK